jgi:hypothetical protein
MIVPRDGGAAQIHNGGEMLRLFLHETPRQLSLIYQELGISPDMTRIHHMNKSIMQKMDRQMIRDGLPFQLEWMFSEYGNISAASALMHLVRSELKQGDIIALHGLAIGGFYATDFFRIGPKDLRFRERDGRRPLYLDGWESKQALYRLSEDGKTAIFL